MSEYLIQSESLDEIADAINAKTGGSAAMTPAEMVEAIGNIPSGSGILEGITGVTIGGNGIRLSDANIVDKKLLVDLSGKDITLSGAMFGTNPVSDLEVTIKCNRLTVNSSPFSLPSSGRNGKSVTFQVNQEYLRFYGNHFTGGTGSLKQFNEFYGLPIYVTSANSGNYGQFSRANICHMDFWENVATNTMYFGASAGMDKSTSISLANALKVTPEGSTYTVTYNSTPKARLSTIMGKNESVTRGEGESLETYDRFVADENGTVTLLDFITNTKGWTVA